VKTRATSMISLKGNPVPNQIIIRSNNARYFQSYGTIIARVYKGKTTLDVNYWDYSRTTSKYRCMFLGETTQETKKQIKSGEYKLSDLNN